MFLLLSEQRKHYTCILYTPAPGPIHHPLWTALMLRSCINLFGRTLTGKNHTQTFLPKGYKKQYMRYVLLGQLMEYKVRWPSHFLPNGSNANPMTCKDNPISAQSKHPEQSNICLKRLKSQLANQIITAPGVLL